MNRTLENNKQKIIELTERIIADANAVLSELNQDWRGYDSLDAAERRLTDIIDEANAAYDKTMDSYDELEEG